MFPFNQQEFTYPNGNKLLNKVSESWKDWLSEDTMKLYRRFGYYSQVLEFKDDYKLSEFQYTKIIAINTLACSLGNFAAL